MVRKRAVSVQDADVGAPKKEGVAESPASTKTPVSSAASILPRPIRFPLLVIMSMGISASAYAAVSPFISGDLSNVSAQRDSWPAVSGLLAWKALELAIGWWGDFDTVDQTSFSFLAHLPYRFFLTSFYKIRPTTALLCLSIDLLAIAAPFYFMRSIVASHRLASPKGTVANRTVINDKGVQLFTSLFASGVYAVVVFGSFGTWMPTYLVTHFDGIKDISSLHNSSFTWLCAAFIPTGFAVKTFLFTPATAAKTDWAEIEPFNGETATLTETVEYNLWGQSARIKTLTQRTALLASFVASNTWLHTFVDIEGAEGFGAAGWSSIWALAAILTGLGFAWVGDVDGITN